MCHRLAAVLGSYAGDGHCPSHRPQGPSDYARGASTHAGCSQVSPDPRKSALASSHGEITEDGWVEGTALYSFRTADSINDMNIEFFDCRQYGMQCDDVETVYRVIATIRDLFDTNDEVVHCRDTAHCSALTIDALHGPPRSVTGVQQLAIEVLRDRHEWSPQRQHTELARAKRYLRTMASPSMLYYHVPHDQYGRIWCPKARAPDSILRPLQPQRPRREGLFPRFNHHNITDDNFLNPPATTTRESQLGSNNGSYPGTNHHKVLSWVDAVLASGDYEDLDEINAFFPYTVQREAEKVYLGTHRWVRRCANPVVGATPVGIVEKVLVERVIVGGGARGRLTVDERHSARTNVHRGSKHRSMMRDNPIIRAMKKKHSCTFCYDHALGRCHRAACKYRHIDPPGDPNTPSTDELTERLQNLRRNAGSMPPLLHHFVLQQDPPECTDNEDSSADNDDATSGSATSNDAEDDEPDRLIVCCDDGFGFCSETRQYYTTAGVKVKDAYGPMCRGDDGVLVSSVVCGTVVGQVLRYGAGWCVTHPKKGKGTWSATPFRQALRLVGSRGPYHQIEASDHVVHVPALRALRQRFRTPLIKSDEDSNRERLQVAAKVFLTDHYGCAHSAFTRMVDELLQTTANYYAAGMERGLAQNRAGKFRVNEPLTVCSSVTEYFLSDIARATIPQAGQGVLVTGLPYPADDRWELSGRVKEITKMRGCSIQPRLAAALNLPPEIPVFETLVSTKSPRVRTMFFQMLGDSGEGFRQPAATPLCMLHAARRHMGKLPGEEDILMRKHIMSELMCFASPAYAASYRSLGWRQLPRGGLLKRLGVRQFPIPGPPFIGHTAGDILPRHYQVAKIVTDALLTWTEPSWLSRYAAAAHDAAHAALIQPTKRGWHEFKVWAHHAIFNASMSGATIATKRRLYAELQSQKRDERLRRYKYFQDQPDVAERFTPPVAQLKDEPCRYNKVDRLFVKLDGHNPWDTNLDTGRLPPWAKKAIDGIMRLVITADESVSVEVHIPLEGDLDAIELALRRLHEVRSEPGAVVLAIYSDDSCLSGNIRGHAFSFNCDLEKADGHMAQDVMTMVHTILSQYDPQVADVCINQCRQPVKMANPANPKEYFLVEPKYAILLSGSTITTLADTTGDLVVGIAMIVWLVHAWDGDPSTLQALFEDAAREVGFNVKMEPAIDSAGAYSVYSQKLLQRVWDPITQQSFLSPGCMIRTLGQYNGVLSAKILGWTQNQFDLASDADKMHRIVAMRVAGWVHEPPNAFLNELRELFQIAEPLPQAWLDYRATMGPVHNFTSSKQPPTKSVDYAICRHLGCDVGDLEEFALLVRQLQPGITVKSRFAALAYNVAYGVPLGSPVTNTWHEHESMIDAALSQLGDTSATSTEAGTPETDDASAASTQYVKALVTDVLEDVLAKLDELTHPSSPPPLSHGEDDDDVSMMSDIDSLFDVD